jgi:hypothetical protein
VSSDWKLLRGSGRFNDPIWKFCSENWRCVNKEEKTKTALMLRVQDSEKLIFGRIPLRASAIRLSAAFRPNAEASIDLFCVSAA